MRKYVLITILLLMIHSLGFANTAHTSQINHVIYITLDGIRWQDIMQDKHFFPKLWQQHAGHLTIYGQPGNNDMMEAASIPISLPSYQTQMTGAIQPCQDNLCGQVKTRTLTETLLKDNHLSPSQVAVFSSWPVIADALESVKGAIYSNVGNKPVVDPFTSKPDATMQRINHLQTLSSHYKGNRLDQYTFAQALHYFKKYQPTFLWISLVNADNEAHDNQKLPYQQYLSRYDDYLDTLFNTLKQQHLDKNTLVIVTTDHGRGYGDNWITHGPDFPESKQTWAFVMNGKLTPVGQKQGKPYYSTLSIRPTIEAALNVNHRQ